MTKLKQTICIVRRREFYSGVNVPIKTLFALFTIWLMIASFFYVSTSAAFPLQQTDGTPSPTNNLSTSTSTITSTTAPSPSGTLDTTLTVTTSPTSSEFTPSHTPTLSPTLTPGVTASPLVMATATPLEATSTSPLLEYTQTPTLIPFPTVTFIYPEENPIRTMLASFREPDLLALQKELDIPWQKRMMSFWPLCLLGGLWLLLGAWFVYSQRRVD